MTCDIEGMGDSAQVAGQSFADIFAAQLDILSGSAESKRESAKDVATVTEVAPLLYSPLRA